MNSKATLKVFKFEFVRQVKKPAFWAATLLIPLLIGGIYFISFISSQGANEKPELKDDTKVAIVDKAGVFTEGAPYVMDVSKEDGVEMVKNGEVDLYFYIPEDFAEEKKAEFYHVSEGLDIFNNDGNILKTLLLNDAAMQEDELKVLALTGKYEIVDNKLTSSGEAANALGKAMLAGRSGMTQTVVDGRDAFIFYRPLQRTGWSIAIVCPVSDVFSRYNSLVFSVWIIVAVGLLLFMLFCYLIVHRAMQPLSQLDEQAKRIAEGQFDEPLPESSRNDSVGRLTNSFISMQQSLAESVASIRRVNTELQQQNDELSRAYQLKLETNRQKTRFIQDMYHEIRTPLNIISGFAQVLTESLHVLPADEVEDITARMQESSQDISRLAHELGEAATNISQNGLTKE